MNARKTEKPPFPFREKNGMSLPQKKLLAICIGALFAQYGASVAYAQSAFGDSAVGVDTVMGNALNLPGRPTVPQASAEDGYDTVRRTPTGQLHGIPIDRSNEDAKKTESGWIFSGITEFGLLGWSPDAKYSKFREYKDLSTGLKLNYFDLEADKPDDAYFVRATGGGVGQNDQFYDLQAGRYNSWRVRAFYNETPHVFSDTFKPIFNPNLSTLNGRAYETLNPAYGSAAVNPAIAQNPITLGLPADQEVALIRKKAGMRVDFTLSEAWKVYASATQEKREGARPYGFMGVEGVEPIDYKTSDFLTGVQYFKDKTAVNLRASLSLFQNDIKQLYVRNSTTADVGAYPVTALANIFTYTYTLPPDNTAISLKGDGSQRFDFWNSKLTGGFSWTSSRNNDSLRMPLDPSFLANGTAMGAGLGTAADWNGVNGCPMSRCDSDLRVDSRLYNLGWSMDPRDDLTVRAGFRRYEDKNKSPTFYAANPLLGGANATSFGVPFSGFFNTAVAFSTPASNTLAGFTGAGPSYFSPPRSDRQTNYTLSSQYSFSNTQSVDLALEREDYSHTYRERDKTWEDKIKASYVNRDLGIDSLTLRASLEGDRKRGSFYDPLVTTRPLASFMTLNGLPYSRSALQWMINTANATPGGAGTIALPGGGTYTLAQLQTAILGNNGSGGQANSGGFMKIDQADRNQAIFNGRLNYAAREDLDLGLSLQMKRIKYPANNFGLEKDDQDSVNLDATYQPAFGTQITAYYSRQNGKQRSIENYGYSNANNAAFSAATLLTYVQGICGALVSSNVDCWLNNSRDPSADVVVDTTTTTDVFGLSAMQDFGWAKMGLTYNYMRGKTSIDHQYWANGGAALTAAQQATLAQSGDYPDMTTTMQSIEFNIVKDINKWLTARFMYRYENFRTQDWHYDYLSGPYGVTNGYAGYTPADFGPANYHINVIGFFLQYKL